VGPDFSALGWSRRCERTATTSSSSLADPQGPRRARLARAGADATIVAYGVAVHWATDAADVLAADGRSIEVVDLRSLLPWDSALVLESAGPVCRCPYLTGLEELTLDCIGSGVLTDADIGALLDNPALANLKRVTLHAAYKADQPGEAVVSRLRDRFGGNFSTEPRLHDD
jgi:transketolase C-terminal domain/subunit